jgi:hypothetical protein
MRFSGTYFAAVHASDYGNDPEDFGAAAIAAGI